MAEPTNRQFSWLSEVMKKEPRRYDADDAYVFSNNRKFKSTDKTNSGVYGGS